MARKPVTKDMGTLAAVASTPAQDSSYLYEFDRFVTVGGTFVATFKVEISNDNVTWVQDGADITTAKAQAVTGRAKFTRVRCSAYTSGTAAISMYGVQSPAE